MPDQRCYQCTDDDERWLEGRLVWGITAFERIPDDRILPNRFVVEHARTVTPYCGELGFIRAETGSGSVRGYVTTKPIKDIDADFGKIKKRQFEHNGRKIR